MPVQGAPSLGSNPYIGAASGAAGAAASLVNALNEASNQQQRLQNQQAQQARTTQMEQMLHRAELIQKGAVPYQPYLEQRDASGMIQRTPNPAISGMDQSRVMSFPALGENMSVYLPSEDELQAQKEKRTGKSSATLSDSLAQEAQQAGLNVDSSTPYSTPMIGEINNTIAHHTPAHAAGDIDTEHFTRDGKPVPVIIDREKGTYRELKPEDGSLQGALTAASGAAQSSAQAAAGSGNANDGTASIFPWAGPSQTAPSIPKPGDSYQFNRKPSAEKQPRIESSTDDKGNVTVTAFDPEKGTQLWQQKISGAGKTSEQQERFAERQQDRADARSQREQDRQDRLADAAKTRHDALQSKEQDQWNLQSAYGDLADASKHKDGDFVPEPRYNASTGEITEGQDVQMTPQRRKVYAALAGQAKTKAQSFHSQAADIRKKYGWGEFAKQDQPAAAAQQGPPAPQKTAAPQPKQNAAAKGARLTGKRIRVKLNDGTGRTGSIDLAEYDPKTMSRL